MVGDEIIAVNDIDVKGVENAVEDFERSIKGELNCYILYSPF